MPKYICVFVCEDKKSLWGNSTPEEVESVSPIEAGIFYKTKSINHGNPLGPYVSVSELNGAHIQNFKITDFNAPEAESSPCSDTKGENQAFLESIRDQTCYPNFRKLVGVFTGMLIVLGGLFVLVTTSNGLKSNGGAGFVAAMMLLFMGSFVVLGALVFKQFLILITDAVDLRIQESIKQKR